MVQILANMSGSLQRHSLAVYCQLPVELLLPGQLEITSLVPHIYTSGGREETVGHMGSL